MTNVPRWLERRLRSALAASPVVVVTGARQVGKTTLATSIDPARTVHTLDDLGVLDQALNDPDSLVSQGPVLIDEVQRAPGLMLAIKRRVDQRRRAGEFLLTGSANLLLMGRVTESLAGRAVYLELPPFCAAEWGGRKGGVAPIDALFGRDFDLGRWPRDRGDFRPWLLRGGLPPALQAQSDEHRDLWLGGYVATYLERDLRQLSAVSSLPDFQRLMRLLANRTARLLNLSEVARDAAMAQPTCHRHVNLLEAGCLITRLSPYATNPSTSLVKAKKLLFTDCGLACWLAGMRSAATIGSRLDLGFWLEQAVFPTLQSWRSLDPGHRRLYYWRDRSGHEVDFVLEQDAELVAIEIKLGAQVTQQDAAGIRAFAARVGRGAKLCRGVVLHSGAPRQLGDGIVALPWGWALPA